MIIKTIIIDDEIKAIETLEMLLTNYCDGIDIIEHGLEGHDVGSCPIQPRERRLLLWESSQRVHRVLRMRKRNWAFVQIAATPRIQAPKKRGNTICRRSGSKIALEALCLQTQG